jgi:NAD(P)-dependent dehydrogenase (short-subunit alcohol dehydrogenase family)
VDLGLRGRTAYITGGAHGIGEAIADTLVSEGVRVVVADADVDQLTRKEQAWSSSAASATVAADLATRDGAESAANRAIDLLGDTPDILVNNVGIGFTRSFDATTDQEWLDIFSVNFFSHVRASRVIVPRMAERGSGSVVNIASDLAKQPEPTTSTYSATKAAVLSLNKALSLEYAHRGVRVNAVCPGPIWTRLWTKPGGVVDELCELYGVGREEAIERFVGERKIPLGIGEPADVAAFVAYLASPRAKHLTGCAYDVNGGSVRSLF